MADDDRILAAVANNAAWCDLVCRCAGLPTDLGPDLWSTPRRSPDAYPDAVTLRPGSPWTPCSQPSTTPPARR